MRAAAALVAGSAGVWLHGAAEGQVVQGAAPRQPVLFQVSQTTVVGQSVFVLGNLAELGGNDMTRAVKLDPSGYPLWRATISLPAGSNYTYRFVVRNDAPGQTSNPANGSFVSAPISAATAPQPVAPPSKVLVLTWDVPSPVLWWRDAGSTASFLSRPFEELGPGADGRPQDTQWLAWGFGQGGRGVEFYVTDAVGGSRYPASGQYTTMLDGAFLQEGQLYSYVPAAAPAAARRDYNPSSVPTLWSPQLGEQRGYRVFLPRGYDQHGMRRYPVLYMHDGQNVFEVGPFGSWNAATTLTQLQSRGQMREVIVVALDNGPNRLTDYLPPTDFLTGPGEGDDYLSFIRDTVKPFIDTTYRTLPGADTTGALGSSMGGVISLYAGWDFTGTFTRVGLLSGAWQTCPTYLARVRSTAPRPIRIAMDSGDSGTASDNYWPTYNLRDSFVGGTAPGYSLDGSLRHVVGYGQQHNEAAWAARLPGALTFLYPSQEEANDILRTVFNPSFDALGNSRVDVDDLYAHEAGPADRTLDGLVTRDDAVVMSTFLRRGERAGLLQGRD